MNKNLLLGSALLAALSAFPQTGRQMAKPNGQPARAQFKPIQDDAPVTPHKMVKSPAVNAVTTSPAVAAKTASTSAVSCTHFSGSANALGVYDGGQVLLGYDANVNTITFVHRSAPSYSTVPNGNTGTIVSKYSTNNGTSWDSTVIWANTTNFGRYPQGGLYNPPGNTTASNAYVLAAGPTNQGGPWNGFFLASKKLTFPGTMTGGTDQQFFNNTSPFGPSGVKSDFPRYGFSYTTDGLVRMLGAMNDDINGTTNLAYNPRGSAILKGTFNAGAFVWTSDTIHPPVNLRSDGSRFLTDRYASMAWNESGTVGYVMMIGVRAGSTGAMRGFQPIVYKTTNSGASWAILPANDFTTAQFQGIYDRLYPVVTNSLLVVPFFNAFNEGIDMTVDVNNQLHIATTMMGTYSSDPDSSDYNYNFGSQQYSYPFNGPFGFNYIYDVYTTPVGWNYHIVDSMGTMGPSGTSGYPGYSNNPWAASGGAVEARIQIGHSPDRKQIFYSWTETDTTITPGLNWNQFPNIKSRGFDVTIDKVTSRVNVTGGVTSPSNADQTAYFHYMSDRTILTNAATGTNEIPFTISYNTTFDISAPTNHYYLKGASFQNSDFNQNPLRPLGVQSLAANKADYEVSNFPNPANGSTTVMVSLKEAKAFDLSIHNSVGQLIKTINVNGQVGNNEVNLDLSNLSAGVYMYSVKASNSVVTKKLIVQ